MTAAAVPTLIGVLRRLYDRDARGDSGAASVLLPVLAALADADGPEQQPERQQLPACALLPGALEAASRSPLAALAAAFAAVEPSLRWVQNPNYTVAKMGAAYMAGYAYANLVGPDGPIDRPGVQVGMLLLGPGLVYPDHAHPAAEVYHVVSGTAAWRRDEDHWKPRVPGACIHHPAGMRHATRTGDETLLAWYCWHGDTATYADLTGQPEGGQWQRRGKRAN